MALSANERFAGVEDEFRVSANDGRSVLIEELVARSERFFFDESAHVPIFEPDYQTERRGWRIWTWYGGTLYHDYDVQGSLVEATTPLNLLSQGAETLVRSIMTQRAQLAELCRGHNVVGVSTHLSMTLDSAFGGDDLCRFEMPVPSNAFVSVPAQKLGADIALLATQTVSPVIAYLLFNRTPQKGALYRPRKQRRMELCLPYVVDPDQMRAGFAFWFAAVDCFTGLIKSDLGHHRDWIERYSAEDYYRGVLEQMPHVLRGVHYQRPAYYLGYQLGSSQELKVMEDGSRTPIETESGSMTVVDLGREWVGFVMERSPRFAASPELPLVLDFLHGRKVPAVDRVSASPPLRMDMDSMEETLGGSIRSYLARHRVDEVASVHIRFLESPSRVVNPYSRRLPLRVVRNLGKELEWNHITFEVIEEDEYAITQHLLEVPLAEVEEYVRAEEYCGSPYVYLAEIRRWVKARHTAPNPRSIFAYGTLMSPEENARRFGAAIRSVRRAHAYGEVYDFGEYPVLMESPRSGVVPGVVLGISNFEETVARFDVYEGGNEPNPIFIRALREVVVEDFHRVTTWVYIGNKNNRFVSGRMRKAPRLTSIWTKPGLRSSALPSG